MKKTYEAPMFEIESFAFAANIANECRFEGTSTDVSCAYEENGWYVYSDSNGACVIKKDESEFCYDVPTADTRVFGS